MLNYIRKHEWLKEGFFNGYYDNQKNRVKGKKNNVTRMILISQVFPIISGVAQEWQIKHILKSVRKYLFDKKLKGYHLNTNFRSQQHNLGRAFSFVYGDKENGAFFNHMIVLFAYALYKRGFFKEGWGVLKSIYDMAMNTKMSKIYPGLCEYFNLQGQGMYPYLTGSASWFVLTLVSELFGLKGKDGNLIIEPKLYTGQFRNKVISIQRNFAGKRLEVNFSFSKKTSSTRLRILKATLNSIPLSLKEPYRIELDRNTVINLPSHKLNIFNIILG